MLLDCLVDSLVDSLPSGSSSVGAGRADPGEDSRQRTKTVLHFRSICEVKRDGKVTRHTSWPITPHSEERTQTVAVGNEGKKRGNGAHVGIVCEKDR
jgi:hypothetical protein